MTLIRSTLGTALGGATVAGALGVGIYWWLRRGRGTGWGFGLGGGGGESILGVHPPAGPALEKGGEDGTEDKKGSNEQSDGGGSGQHSPGASQGAGAGDSGDGQTGQGAPKGGSGDGQGGDGSGGIGGGSGGGVGSGTGDGQSSGDDEHGGSGSDGGGAADPGPYSGAGGLLIDTDLPPPDLSAAKLAAIRETVEDLVLGAVFDPGASNPALPGILHQFDPERGSVLNFWADVALHHHYSIPPGRLDPDNQSHVPWINLWLDILAYVSLVESKALARSNADPLHRLLFTTRVERNQ